MKGGQACAKTTGLSVRMYISIHRQTDKRVKLQESLVLYTDLIKGNQLK